MVQTYSQRGKFLCSLNKVTAWPVMQSYYTYRSEKKKKFPSYFMFSGMWLDSPHFSKIKMEVLIAVTNIFP